MGCGIPKSGLKIIGASMQTNQIWVEAGMMYIHYPNAFIKFSK